MPDPTSMTVGDGPSYRSSSACISLILFEWSTQKIPKCSPILLESDWSNLTCFLIRSLGNSGSLFILYEESAAKFVVSPNYFCFVKFG